MKRKQEKLLRRKNRVLKTIKAHTTRPILYVKRSLKHIYAQIVDRNWKVIAAASDLKIEDKKTKTERAQIVWEQIAEKAKKAGVEKIAFARCGYKYHGRVKALAEAARKGWLVF